MRAHPWLVLTMLLSAASPSLLAAQETCIPGRCVQGAAAGGAAAVNRYALLVGVSEYKYLPKLDYADDDAVKMRDLLLERGLVAESKIFSLIDKNATTQAIRNRLDDIFQKTMGVADSEVIIYLAGHANTEAIAGEPMAFFLTHPTSADGNYRGEGFPFEELNKYVNNFAKRGVRVILITDACRSGNLVGGESAVKAASTELAAEHDKAMLIVKYTSSQGGELSKEGSRWRGGVFTHFLTKGWSGAAADRETGVLTAARLGTWVQDQVMKATPDQTPQPSVKDARYELAKFTPDQIVRAIEELNQFNQAGTQLAVADAKTRDVPPIVVALPAHLLARYDSFTTALRAGAFRPGQAGSAWQLFERTQADSADVELERVMRFDLIMALEAGPQEAIHNYLVGGNDQPGADVFQRAAQDMALVVRLTSADAPGLPSVQAKQLFFDAYSIIRGNERLRYREAMSKLERARVLLPDAAYITNALGIAYLDLDRFAQAEGVIRKAMDQAPGWTYPRNLLGILRKEQRRYEEAISAYQSAIALDSLAYYALNNLGNIYWDLGRYQQAEQLYRRSMAADPRRSIAHANLAHLYRSMNRYRDAAAEVALALHKDSVSDRRPNWVWPKIVFGHLHRDLSQLGRSQEAVVEQMLKRAMEQAPFEAQPVEDLASLYHHQKRYDLAEEYYRKAIQLDSSYVSSYSGLADLMLGRRNLTADAGKRAELVRIGEQLHATAIRSAAHPAEPLDNYGDYLAWLGGQDTPDKAALLARADSAYRAALRADSLYLEVYFNLADVARERDDFEAAESWYRSAERIGTRTIGGDPSARSPIPATRLAQFFYARAYQAADTAARRLWLDSAAVAYQRAIRIDSTYPEARSDLGALLLERGDYANAAAQWRIASRLGFQSKQVDSTSYARAFQAEAARTKRADLYESAIAMNRGDHRLHHELALLHLRTGKLAAAATSADAALQLADAPDVGVSIRQRYLVTRALIALEGAETGNYLERLEQLRPNVEPATLLTIALLQHASGAPEAISTYQNAVQRNPSLKDEAYLAARYTAAVLKRIKQLRDAAE